MIKEFQGTYRFLSNFWPCEVVLDRITYRSVEHAYQAAKTLDFHKRILIRRAATPGDAKRLGKQIIMRSGWNDLKLPIMESLLVQKFATGTDLCGLLIATGNQVIQEGNRWGDKFWGVDLRTGQGQNHMGRLLMKIRQDLLARDR